MLKKIILALALVGSSATAFAQFDGDSSTSSRDHGSRHDCSIYDRNPRACDADQSCFFDYRYNGCVDADQGGGGGHGGGHGGGTTYCPRWDNDPRSCNAQTWCQWDAWSNRCEDIGGGGGGGHPHQTWECTAVDEGWEEHRQGHTAQGRDYNDAQDAALDLCERYHGRCEITNCRQVR